MSRFFGEIRQNGYVVHDIQAAMKHWTEVLGVGPFFYVEKPPIKDFRYYGEPSDAEMSIALSNSGSLQIELIQQRNEGPSMYRDFLKAGREGLQHVAYWTNDFDADFERLRSLGYEAGQSDYVGRPDGRFVYFATETHPGTVIELSEVSGPKGKLFKRIAQAASNWDGSDPIRSIGT
jgi:catechol 2,3-dioxygenase-like lactoylglutathione lyase family enzyme